jgi:HSP20 family protein
MAQTLISWVGAPTRLYDDLRQEMNELMQRFFTSQTDGRELGWFAPRSNIIESDKDYEVTVDLPGMKPDDFNVEFREGSLRISGERKLDTSPERKDYRCVGCQYGRFEDVIALDVPVQADQVQAAYKDGVLRVTIPKQESAQPRRILVKSS